MNRSLSRQVACILASLTIQLSADQLVEAALVETPSREQIVEKGLEYFRSRGQAEDGTFSARMGPGLTAMALTAALRNGVSTDDQMVAKGLTALETFVKPDGGIYGNGRIKNYETCVAIVAFKLANKDQKYDEILANADKFVRGLQYGADSNKDPTDPWFGGVGYGGPERPDLSNTSYLMEAMAALDDDVDDATMQRALIFVSRCQNLKSTFNDTKFAGLINDGGFYYAIPTEAVDPSEDERYTEDGGLRSYGSMSYAGFKSLVYAKLGKEDPRVKAVRDWIRKNYTVQENPGVGTAGLYYYFHSFASALNAAEMDNVVDDEGVSHNWRAELIAELAKRQNQDGSWTNENRQWFENDPNLATAFALIALSYCD